MRTLLFLLITCLPVAAQLTNRVPISRFPLTNRLAGSNLIPIVVNPLVTNGTMRIRVDNFFSNVAFYGTPPAIGVQTNANQFGASPAVTIKSAALLTNATHYGATLTSNFTVNTDATITSGDMRWQAKSYGFDWYSFSGDTVIFRWTNGGMRFIGGFNVDSGTIVGDGSGLTNITSTSVIRLARTAFSAASTKQIDPLISGIWEQTNRLTAATTLNITNIAAGDQLSITIAGEASGGTDRGILLSWPANWWATYANDLATNGGASTVTCTNGQSVEFSISCGFLAGTNTARVVYSRFSR